MHVRLGTCTNKKLKETVSNYASNISASEIMTVLLDAKYYANLNDKSYNDSIQGHAQNRTRSSQPKLVDEHCLFKFC